MPGTKRKSIAKPTVQPKVIEVVFYQTEVGNEPAKDWLVGLSKEDRKLMGTAIKEAEFGWPIGLPVVRKMEANLWEVRQNLTDKKIGRVLFTVDNDTDPSGMVLLHGFVKKSQKTPKTHLDIAKKRLKDYMAS